MLSVRLRQRELLTMHKIGGARARISAILAGEVIIVLLISALLAAALTAASYSYGDLLIRGLIG